MEDETIILGVVTTVPLTLVPHLLTAAQDWHAVFCDTPGCRTRIQADDRYTMLLTHDTHDGKEGWR